MFKKEVKKLFSINGLQMVEDYEEHRKTRTVTINLETEFTEVTSEDLFNLSKLLKSKDITISGNVNHGITINCHQVKFQKS